MASGTKTFLYQNDFKAILIYYRHYAMYIIQNTYFTQTKHKSNVSVK